MIKRKKQYVGSEEEKICTDVIYDSRNANKTQSDVNADFETRTSALEGDATEFDSRLDILESMVPIEDMTWEKVQEIVDAGFAANYFGIGDELTEDWKSTISGTDHSYSNVPMHVAHISDVTIQDNGADATVHGMFLEWKYEAPFVIPFCAPQCIQCFDGTGGTPEGLAAGNYAFKVGSSGLPNWADARTAYAGKYLCFTLADALPSRRLLNWRRLGKQCYLEA